MSKKLEAMDQTEAQQYMDQLLLGEEDLDFENDVEAAMYEKFKEILVIRADMQQNIAKQKAQIMEGEKHTLALNAQLNVIGNLLIELEDDRRALDKDEVEE